MTRVAAPISCPCCTNRYEPSDGYVYTLAGYDHFRCPQCHELCSRVIEADDEGDINS